MKRSLLFVFLTLGFVQAFAQYSQYQLGDTTTRVYPYHLPILGKMACENGFDIPKPVGLMLNYFTAGQDIVIPKIEIGFSGSNLANDIPLTDITDIIEFEEIHTAVHNINVRPDVWILPFLNIYGIIGKTFTTTSVKLSSPIEMTSVAELEGMSYGFGTTGAIGLGRYFVVLDGNWVWNNMSNFKDPVRSSEFSQRIGRTFQLGENKESIVAVWIGGMRVRMGNYTQGTISMAEALPQETWERKDEMVADYWIWYDNLSPLNPANIPKKKLADDYVNDMVDWIDTQIDGSGIVEYRVLKEPEREWNMIIGGQYQINQSWQVRTELGIIGNRKSFLLSVNYRFGF